MNEYQQKMYDELMALVADSETFYYKDFELGGTVFRIFNYRLASYTEFMRPSGLECRGHMFEVSSTDVDATAVRLASLPMPKFFNLYECPATMDLDLSQIEEIADKADGSLITTYMHNGHLSVKSKGSLFSDQANDAKNYLTKSENWDFRDELVAAERLGYTVIMEYVAPHNRIVIGYENEELRVLGVRSRIDGSYVHYDDIDFDVFPEIAHRWTKIFQVDDMIEILSQNK